jgi:hypothetical protein
METTIIIVVAVMITIIASLMIVRSQHPRRTRPEVFGSNRQALPPRTASPSLPALDLSVSSAQSRSTGSNIPTMQTPTPHIRVTGRRPGTTSGQTEQAVTRVTLAVNGASAPVPEPVAEAVTPTPAPFTTTGRREPHPGATPPPGLTDPIRLPDTIQIFHRQTECKICKQDIRWSSRQTGWARCLAANRLVHGHCQNVMTRGANWCAICDGPCASGQPMRVEGLDA